ncbi:hypothetical protein CMI49_01440 [Candidatus Pacearchaeota archaeon]|jgi:DMSO/TMAO reductase YedYZ heme-binding membrane subunit|nr:hypothetical protein [Candidatus Pacearchaeota archaeon]|tara:strand:+ start:36 stop:260 length:225 start_codon:yes stop_codon:yes gene_type:complete
MNKALIIIGLILGIGGVIFSLLPADIHMSIFGGDDRGMDNSMPMNHNHGIYVTWGLVAAIIGFALTLAGWKIID